MAAERLIVYYGFTILRNLPEGSRARQGRLRAAADETLNSIFLSSFGEPFDRSLISRTATGKPFLTGSLSQFSYSVSHSVSEGKGAVLVAVCKAGSTHLGVDVEVARPVFGRTEFQRRYLHDNERSAVGRELFADSDFNLHGAIARLWVAKEAVGKSVGLGIQIGFSQLDASLLLAHNRRVEGAHGVASSCSFVHPIPVTFGKLDSLQEYRKGSTLDGTLAIGNCEEFTWGIFLAASETDPPPGVGFARVGSSVE